MTGSLKQRYLLNKGCRGFRSLIEAIAAFGCFTTRYKKKDFKKAYIRLHWDIEMCWYFMFDIGMKLIKKTTHSYDFVGYLLAVSLCNIIYFCYW